jgi:hypothetical protein
MTNETFEPVGLLDIAKQLKTNRKSVDDLEERLHSALDAKRDVASDYVEQLDSIAEKEVEVKLDPFSDLLQTTIASNSAMWKAGYDAGYDVGYEVGKEVGSEQRDRELLESHGIDVDGFCDDMVKMIKDHEQDTDEDEPDQYPANYGGTK